MAATEHGADLDRCTDVDVVQQRHRAEEGVGDEEGVVGSKGASGSKKKKKKKNKASPGGVFIYKNLVGGPFEVTENATVGRCVVAAKDLGAGEMILNEPPFAKVVRQDCALRHCTSCCRQIHEAARVEASVRYAVYCSRACKDQDAIIRTVEADAVDKLGGISAARDVDLDLLRMLLRLLVMRATALDLLPKDEKDMRGGETGQHEGEDGAETTEEKSKFLRKQWHNVRSLMDHREKMAPEWIRVVRAAAEDLMEIVPAWVRSEVDEAVGLACRVNVNAHGLRDDSGGNNVIGVGLFPLTAMINHSCKPNCTFLFFGGKIEIRALEVIKAGTELNLHYIDLLQSTPDRRCELLASKHFICNCSRCENPSLADTYLDSACCLDCGQDGCLTSTPPQNPEDALAALLAELGTDVAKLGRSSIPGGRKGSRKKKATSGPRKASGDSSVTFARSRDVGVTDSTGADGIMFCSSCGRQYPTVFVDEGMARAKLLWKAAMVMAPAKILSLSKKALEKWLEDFDAGYVAPPSAAKKSPKKIKLHPGNAMVIQALVQLANCCNLEKDYSASAKHLKRAISAMERILPPNYPELGDFNAAVAEALTAYLNERDEALPKKLKNHIVSERNKALEKAAAIRSVCLGPDHPSTKNLTRTLTRA